MAGLQATSAAAVEGNTIALVAYGIQTAVVRTATALWTATQWLLNAALTANPIGIVIVLVAALVAAIIIAYKKSQTFRNIVQGAWRGIQAAAQFVWNNVLKPIFQFIIAYYKMLWTIAQTAVRLIVAAWNGLRAGLSAAWRWIKTNVIDPLIAAFKLAFHWAEVARDRIRNAWNAIKDAINGVWLFIRGIFDKLIGKIQDVIGWFKNIKIPDAVSKVLGKFGVPGFKSAPPVTVVPAPRTGRAATSTATLVGTRANTPVVVNVYLDGKRVTGLVDRVVTNRLNAEGARLASGAWA
jgi:phage-related protein